VRLQLVRLDLASRTITEVIKPLTKIPSQKIDDFEAALKQFLEDIERDGPNWPKFGVIGIAGEVKDNCCFTTNIPHWKRTDGNAIA